MVESDPRLSKVFKKPPMVAYRRPPLLREKLIRSRVPRPGHKYVTQVRMQRYDEVWQLLYLLLRAGGQGGKVHHHRSCQLPGYLLHHLQEAPVPTAVHGQDTVRVPGPLQV